MKLRIVTASQTEQYDIAWVDIHTPSGNSVIMEDHAPMVAVLSAHKKLAFKLKAGKTESIIIEKSGIITIERKEITVLL